MKTLTLVGTSTCMPCKLTKKVLEEYSTITTYIDASEDPELAQMLGVVSVPTLIAYIDTVEVGRHIGLANKVIVEELLG